MNLPKSSLALTLLASFLCVALVSASPDPDLDKGIGLYQKEQYDEAAGYLQKSIENNPQSSRSAYYLGLTFKRLQRYKEAKKQLTDAVTFSPKIREALLELIEVDLQIGDQEGARQSIAIAEKEGMRPAQTAFLKGLVLSKAGEHEKALEAFANAKKLDPSLTQSADYQVGLIRIYQKDYRAADQVFSEILLVDPNTDISAYAREYKKILERRSDIARPLRMSIGLFGEWDDNVILKPSDASTTQSIGEAGDFREVITAGAEYTYRFNDQWGTKFQYDFYLAHQDTTSQFDVNSHALAIAPIRYFKETTVSVPVQVNETRVDDASFLNTVSVTPTIIRRLKANQVLQMAAKFQRKSYRGEPAQPVEDRDGERVAPSIGWFYFFAEDGGLFGLRYEWDKEFTQGEDWVYAGHRVSANVQWPIFVKQLKGIVAGDIYSQDFENTHFFFNEKRHDITYTAVAGLTYEIKEDWEVQLRYTYTAHDSNISLYEYDRNVISMGVVYKY